MLDGERAEVADAIRRLAALRWERDALAERRQRLWNQLGEGCDATTAARASALSRRLIELEDEGRALRARARFGSRQAILGRARMELTVLRGLGEKPA